jgi:hypothetical protein
MYDLHDADEGLFDALVTLNELGCIPAESLEDQRGCPQPRQDGLEVGRFQCVEQGLVLGRERVPRV